MHSAILKTYIWMANVFCFANSISQIYY